MIVISDTSPINYLCRIGQIDILPTLFGKVIVPQAVAEELSARATPAVVYQLITHAPAWIDIRRPNTIDTSLAEFGAGERQAIALASELQADLLIVDDKDARLAAERRHIAVIGTLGVIRLAARQLLLELPTAVKNLRAAGFYMSNELVRELLENSGTNPADS